VGAVVDAAVCLGEFGATELAFIIELNKLVICLFIYLFTIIKTIIIIYTYIKNKVYYYYYLLREQMKWSINLKLKGKEKGERRSILK
jgi:hypothetical protein